MNIKKTLKQFKRIKHKGYTIVELIPNISPEVGYAIVVCKKIKNQFIPFGSIDSCKIAVDFIKNKKDIRVFPTREDDYCRLDVDELKDFLLKNELNIVE